MDETYGTVADFKTYHDDRGGDYSAHTDSQIGQALLIATEWLDGAFLHRFPGEKVGQRAQVREWPRYDVYDTEGWHVPYTSVPVEIERATYEAAIRHLAEPGVLLADYEAQEYDSVRIEGSISVKYRQLNAGTVQKQFPKIGQILTRLLGSTASSLSGNVNRA